MLDHVVRGCWRSVKRLCKNGVLCTCDVHNMSMQVVNKLP